MWYMDKKELEKKVREIGEKLLKAGVPVSPHIEEVAINTRAKKRLGACKRRKTSLGKTGYIIEISQTALRCSEEDLSIIIAHELIHTCRGCFNHGDKWKKMATIAREAYGWDIRRTVKYEDIGLEAPREREKVRYRVVCTKCGKIYERRRSCPLTKEPRKYRCGKCGGTLTLAEKNTTSCR